MKTIRAVALASVAVLALAVGSAKAELIINGDFETGDFTGWTTSGNMSFTDVTDDPTYVESGTYGVQLGAVETLGFLSQSIPTNPGDSYTLEFDLRNDGGTPNQMQVTIGGDLQFFLLNTAAFSWTHYSLAFTGSPASDMTDIEFGFRQDPAWFGLDNVSVPSTVPEPTSLALIGVTAGLLTARRRAL